MFFIEHFRKHHFEALSHDGKTARYSLISEAKLGHYWSETPSRMALTEEGTGKPLAGVCKTSAP